MGSWEGGGGNSTKQYELHTPYCVIQVKKKPPSPADTLPSLPCSPRSVLISPGSSVLPYLREGLTDLAQVMANLGDVLPLLLHLNRPRFTFFLSRQQQAWLQF